MDRLRVLTLNIWNKQNDWPRRLPLIRRELSELAPDVVGLQEVLHLDGDDSVGGDQAREIADGLGYHVAYASAWHIGGGLQFGNAILSRWPIINAHAFQLPGEVGEETRGLLYGELDAPFARVPVFNTHLDWQFHRGYIREQQVRFIVEQVTRLVPTEHGASPRYPPILLGDFNAEPCSDEIRWLGGYTTRLGRSVYFADCFAVAGDGSAGHTFARSNKLAAIAHEPSRRIDYVFVRGPDRAHRGEPLRARVVFDHPTDGLFPTDHYGVLVELSITPAPL
jgi:endonuclease/exonuclease/phosphatase family metal-dependent hydrolase